VSAVLVPKTMTAEEVAWSYRHGVISAMRFRGRLLPRHGHAHVMAPSQMLRLADCVRREYIRRHPVPRDLTTRRRDHQS